MPNPSETSPKMRRPLSRGCRRGIVSAIGIFIGFSLRGDDDDDEYAITTATDARRQVIDRRRLRFRFEVLSRVQCVKQRVSRSSSSY